jgi:cytochrome c
MPTLGAVNASEVPSPAAQRGLTFVGANCADCHAVDKFSASPLKIALPFRTLLQISY